MPPTSHFKIILFKISLSWTGVSKIYLYTKITLAFNIGGCQTTYLKKKKWSVFLWVWPPTGREDGERSEGRRVEDWTDKIASNDSVRTHVLFLFLFFFVSRSSQWAWSLFISANGGILVAAYLQVASWGDLKALGRLRTHSLNVWLLFKQ